MRTFRDALSTRPLAICAEYCLTPETTAEDIAAAAEVLRPVVDAVQLYDNRQAQGHMSGLAAAALFMKQDVDALLHVSCRDRNRIALRGELLGAAALGVSSVVLSRGDKLVEKGGLKGKGVFDISDIRLTEMAANIGRNGSLMSSPGFAIGTTVTVFDAGDDWEAKRISEALDAGARFLQTQPCANARLLRHYLQAVIAKKIPHRASFVIEVPLLTSRQAAETYKRDYPTALLPDASIAKICGADDEVAAGITVCADMLRESVSMPGVSGVVVRDSTSAEHIAAALLEAEIS